MESMEFDPETLLASGSSDPMLGNPAEQQAPTITHEQQAQPPPSGSFIVLQSGGSPGGGPGGVTQLGNISVSSLAPGQGARAATSRLTAVMGRAAGSAPGNLTKFIISPGQATSSAAPVRLLSGATNVRVATPANAPPAVSAAGPGTLTLTSAQAQQMGLISPRKMTTMDGSRPGPSPKRIVIRSSPGQQAKQGGVAAAGSVQPAYRILSQSGLQQTVTAGRGQQGVQFVRVVGSVAGQPAFSNPSIVTNTTAAASANAAVKIAIASGGRLAPPQSAQRLLLPAAPSGGTVLASAGGTGAGMEMLRTVPATGYSRPRPSPQLPRLGRPPNPAVPSRPPQQAQKATAHVARSSRVGGESVPQIRPRKPCNCTKSQCLKLYCDCFASGEFCNNCNCTNCFNSLDREEERQRAIRACLDRNPFAFKPKIGKSDNETRKHQKGCNCKKSGCLKNYCECYEAKIFCSSQCKCMGCKNHESANSSRQSRPGAAGATAMEDPLSLLPSDPGPSTGRGGRRPGGLKVATFPVTERASAAVRVTQDVIDATLSCLMTEAAAAAGTEEAQRRVLREFGRCLSEIIDYGSRRAAEASVPGMV